MLDSSDLKSPPGLKLSYKLQVAGSKIRHVSWSPDGQELAVSTEDNAVWIWDVRNIKLVRKLEKHTGPVLHAVWSPDGRFIATASEDNTIFLWDVRKGRLFKTIETKAGHTINVAWSSDGRLINAALITGKHPKARLGIHSWNVKTGKRVGTYEDSKWDLAYAGISGDRKLLALALTDGVIQVWDMTTVKQIAAIKRKYCQIFGITLTPDGRTAAICVADGSIEIWDIERSERLNTLRSHDGPVYSVCFSQDGRLLASKSRDGTVQFRQCNDWERVVKLEEASVGDEEVELAFHPKAQELATFDEKNSVVRVWNLETIWFGKMITILFLAADPRNLSRLRLGRELQDIQESLRMAGLRENFDVHTRMATKPRDLSQALLDVRPQIVHFSGHGAETGAIFLEDPSGQSHAVPPDALADLFDLVADTVECVVLNACYSQKQAKAIARSIKYVIGMKDKISDSAALAFTTGFYQALGNGKSIEAAYEFGCAQISIQGGPSGLKLKTPEKLTPIFIGGK